MLSVQSSDIQYQLRGINMVTPDQIIDDSQRTRGQSPYTINSRMFAPQDENEPRSSIQARRGAGKYTKPVGEAQNASEESNTSPASQPLSYDYRYAQRFTPTLNKSLTAIEIFMGEDSSNDTVLVEVYEDASGNFGTKVAVSSIARSLIATPGWVRAQFIMAPVLDTTKNYWIIIRNLEESYPGQYLVTITSTGSGLKQSTDAGSTYTDISGSLRFRTYLSEPGTVKGQHRFVSRNGTVQTLFAHGNDIYLVTNEATGDITSIKSGLNPSASRVRFRTVLDKVYIANGYDDMMKWDGVTMTTSTHSVDFKVPMNMWMHKNRMFYQNRDEPNRLYFSDLYPNLETVQNVSFLYVPDPADPDYIVGCEVFQDQLVIFKRNSKWVLVGDDLATFSLNQSPGGTKGAVSQEAISNAETRLYFFSEDGGPYYYDGAQDHAIGDNIQPEVDNIIDHDSVDSIITDREWRIYYKRIGQTEHQRMLLYDLRYEEWFMDTQTYTRSPVVWDLEDNQVVEASSVIGQLYFAEAQFSQLGLPIDFKYWTNYKKYTSGIAKDRVRTFRAIFASPDRVIDVRIGKDSDFDNDARYKNVVLSASGIVYDGGETYGSPTAIYGRGSRVSQPKVALSGRAMNTQYRFEKYLVNAEIRLYGYEAIVKSGRPR